MDKLVTFGVAVYNVAPYLKSCLDSVIAQKGGDFDILLVDDGSTDGSAAVCDEYAARDERVRVVHKENGGVSTARNVMIEQARGQWLCFIDGDDRLTEDAADHIRAYVDPQYPLLLFDALFFRLDSSLPRYFIDKEPLVVQGTEREELILSTMYHTRQSPKYVNKTVPPVWGRLYLTKYLRDHQLRFDPSLRKSQDVVFNLECLRYVTQVKLVRKAIYLYRLNDQSIVNRYNSKILQYNQALVQAFYDAANRYEGPLKEQLMQRYYLTCITILRTCLQLDLCHRKNPNSYRQRQEEFIQLLSVPGYRTALENCKPDLLYKNDQMVYTCSRERKFRTLCRYYKKLYWSGKLHQFANRLGLNRLINPIRQRRHAKRG